MDINCATIACPQITKLCFLDDYTGCLLNVKGATIRVIGDCWMNSLFLAITLENNVSEADGVAGCIDRVVI